MRLAVFDISRFDEAALRPWLRASDCLLLPLNPLGDDDWGAVHCPLTRYEDIAQRHADLFRPLFEAGANNDGPRLSGAEVSFMGAADFSLFIETRFASALLLDLERLQQQHGFSQIDFVSNAADGGKHLAAVRAFAACHGIPLRTVSLDRGEQRLARKVSRAVDAAVGTLWSHAPAYLEAFRSTARRWWHNSPSGSKTQHAPTGAFGSGGTVRAAMLVYHPKSWRYLLPIRRALVEAGHDVLLISPRLASDRVLEDAGVEFVPMRTASPSPSLRRSVADYMSRLPWPSADAELGNLVREGGALRRLAINTALAHCAVYTDVAGPLPRLLKQHRTNVVLGTDSGSVAGRCFYRTATRLGAQRVFVQHGSVHALAGVRQYMLDSYRLLWGANSCETLARCGVARPERIISLGSPFHEARYGFSGTNPVSVESSVAPLALITFGVPGGYVAEGAFRRAAQTVFAAATEFTDVKFVIKPHPGDPGNVWREMIQARGLKNVELCITRDTYDLMRECGLLLTMFSTTGSEAICMGKPVVSVNPDDRPGGEEYLNAGAAYSVRDDEGLIEVFREVFGKAPGHDRLGEVRRTYAESFFHREDRPAAHRAVDFLENLVQGPQSRSADDAGAVRSTTT